MAIWPLQPSRANRNAERLLQAVTEVSRRPSFFGSARVPDTLEGRFELMALNACLALIRLRGDADAGPLSQAFTDRLFRAFDAGLREDGVGDLSVPKRMRKLAASFYGRLGVYAGALSDASTVELEAALARNALGRDVHPFAASLAAYARETARRHAEAPIEALFDAAAWPAPEA
jgi:cytochrome b pre-mRNA-processing protein 3